MKEFKVGMYGGKFMPFHKGHLYCVDYASSQCEKLYVLLFHGGDQEIEILKTRNDEWLKPENRLERIKMACSKYKNVEVVPVDITNCKYPDGSEDWDAETQLVLDICGPLDAVYGSEPEYADYFHRAYPNAIYKIVDVDRELFPISGTMIRKMNKEEREKWIV